MGEAGWIVSEPVINVTRSSMPAWEEYCEEIRSLWDSCWLTNMGAKHSQFQAELTRYLGAKGLDLLTNGHMALELSLQAMKLEGEVITTPFTFASTTQAIVRSGLTPVFCDIDPVTFNLDPARLEALITPRTCAVLPVHVYGTPCDVEGIDQIARRHGLKVIYDAAHAFGVTYKGRGIAAFGDASCFSFHATKVFHSIEGGAVSFQDEMFGRRLASMKNFGLAGEGNVPELGANAKMNEFCAAMGLCNLRHIDENIQRRKRAAERYRAHLEGVPGLQLAPVLPDVRPNYAYFPVVFDETVFGADRDEVLEVLERHQIMARRYFYPLTSEFSCYHGRFAQGKTPMAEWISRRVLTLPMYAEIEENTVDRVCEVVLSCRRQV